MKAEETTLTILEPEWGKVGRQLSWKLELCLRPIQCPRDSVDANNQFSTSFELVQVPSTDVHVNGTESLTLIDERASSGIADTNTN